MQDRLGLFIAYFTTIAGAYSISHSLFLARQTHHLSSIVALITGSVYIALPETSAGAFTRGGLIFITILFNAFQAFNELPLQMMGRPIMWKQSQNFMFFRPR